MRWLQPCVRRGSRWFAVGRTDRTLPPRVSRTIRHTDGIDDVPPTLLSVRHIGPRRARRLVNALGPGWQATVRADPERVFATLRGVGPRQAAIAAASWNALAAERRRPSPADHG